MLSTQLPTPEGLRPSMARHHSMRTFGEVSDIVSTVLRRERSPSTIRFEQTFLLVCLKQDDFQTHLNQIRAYTQQQPDWHYILRAAAQHQVTPLRYQSLQQAGVSDLPPEIEEYLRHHCRVNGLKNLFLFSQLQTIRSYFSDVNIPVVALRPTYHGSGYRLLYISCIS